MTRLRALLFHRDPEQVQQGLELLEALGPAGDALAAELLTGSWRSSSPGLRTWVELTLLSRIPLESAHPWSRWRAQVGALNLLARPNPPHLPEGLAAFPQLRRLQLPAESLTRPWPAAPLPQVEELLLTHGDATAPLELARLPGLRSLSLRMAGLPALPAELPPRLTRLDVSLLHGALPAGWFEATALETLLLGGLGLKRLPAGRAWAGLTGFRSYQNPLEDLSALAGCRALRQLALRGASLRRVPPEVSGLRGLERFEWTYGQLETVAGLPLSGLETLDLTGNTRLSAPGPLPDSLRTLLFGGTDVDLDALGPLPAGLTMLCLPNAGLTRWPQNLPEGLTTLDLSGNQLDHWPTSLPPRLAHLRLSENQLSEVPRWILAHPTLTQLTVGRNPIRSLPMPPCPGPRLDSLRTSATRIPEEQQTAWHEAVRARGRDVG